MRPSATFASEIACTATGTSVIGNLQTVRKTCKNIPIKIHPDAPNLMLLRMAKTEKVVTSVSSLPNCT